MKLWIDDLRPAPEGYRWLKSVNQAKEAIEVFESFTSMFDIEIIDLDHDAGDYANDGGDYIKLLDWLEETGRSYSIHIHSMNVVGRMNMETICKRNNWTIID